MRAFISVSRFVLPALVVGLGWAGVSQAAPAQTKAAVQPGASSALTVTSAQFAQQCKDDIGAAKTWIDRFKREANTNAMHRLNLYDEASRILDNAAARASLAHEVHPDKALRSAAEACEQAVSSVVTEISLDRAVYEVLSSLDISAMDASSRYYVQTSLLRFRLAGVDRDDATRARIRQLNDEMVRISQTFGRHIREDVQTLHVSAADLDGLPEDFVRAHPPGTDGKVSLSTDTTDFVPVMFYARKASVREAMWRLYNQRAYPANAQVLKQLLVARHELARLVGFDHWADYVMADKMIGNAKQAQAFIDRISGAAQRRMEQDTAMLLKRKRTDEPGAEQVLPWDGAYLNERLKAETLGLDSQAVRPYFQYQRVKDGVMKTTTALFGLRYERVHSAPVWHPDVEVFDVMQGKRRMGRIYLDMHPRTDKYKHYAQFTLAKGKRGYALPEGVLVCNFPQPSATDPGLMEHDDVVTFFHEFGHLLHHVMGGHVRWAGQSGVANEWDFVEAPSQLLEEWARHPQVLRSFATHYKSAEPIALDLAEKLREASDFARGRWVRQQMFYAALSLQLHNRDPHGLNLATETAQIQSRYAPTAHISGSHMYASFGHLDGYSAIYYTYMWSMVIAKDLFTPFMQGGNVMNPNIAHSYRRTVLEAGGTKPAAQLVRDFLGRSYGFDAYANWLDKQP